MWVRLPCTPCIGLVLCNNWSLDEKNDAVSASFLVTKKQNAPFLKHCRSALLSIFIAGSSLALSLHSYSTLKSSCSMEHSTKPVLQSHQIWHHNSATGPQSPQSASTTTPSLILFLPLLSGPSPLTPLQSTTKSNFSTQALQTAVLSVICGNTAQPGYLCVSYQYHIPNAYYN